MKDFLNIIEEDIFVTDSFDALLRLYNSNLENKPFSLIICREGELSIEINLKKHTINPKQIMVYLPYKNAINNVTVSPDFKCIILCLSERLMFENFNMQNNLWEKAFAVTENPVIDVNDEIEELFEHYGKLLFLRMKHKERLYQREVLTTLVKALMYEFLNEINSTLETPGKSLLKQGDILFKKFITLLSSMEVKPRMVNWYAQQLCVTPKYLSTTCKAVSGKTANAWINQFVIRDITNMLKYSDKSIKEISEYLEFPNISFFGKYVKAHMGCSPKEYRRLLKERN